MKIMLRAFLFLLGLIVLPAAAAEEALVDTPFALTLEQYNAVTPKQSDQYQRGSRLIGGRVFDGQNRAIGNINDITIEPAGSIHFLNAQLTGNKADLPLSYGGLQISPTQGGYKLPNVTKNSNDALAQIMASTAPAAGSNAANALSVKDLIGSPVASDKNVRIGAVEDVIFESNGGQAYALLVRVNYRSVSGRSVAIPLKAASYARNGPRYNVSLSEGQTQTLLTFAR